MLLTTLPPRGILGHGPRAITTNLISARSVGSIPRLQAQLADITSTLDSNARSLPPSAFSSIPVRGAAPPPVRPVVSAYPQNRDEFWRKVPVWRNISAKEFLSHSWSVSLWVWDKKMRPFSHIARRGIWSKRNPSCSSS